MRLSVQTRLVWFVKSGHRQDRDARDFYCYSCEEVVLKDELPCEFDHDCDSYSRIEDS
jgi:hypothetical protein